MTTYPPAPDCTRPARTGLDKSCLQVLAEGFTASVLDLCAGCTQRFMTGLDWITGTDLPWCQGIRDNAHPSREPEDQKA